SAVPRSGSRSPSAPDRALRRRGRHRRSRAGAARSRHRRQESRLLWRSAVRPPRLFRPLRTLRRILAALPQDRGRRPDDRRHKAGVRALVPPQRRAPLHRVIRGSGRDMPTPLWSVIMSNLPRVEIEYCTQCRWLLRAAWMAQELLTTFEQEIGEVALRPGTGGVFEVRVDGATVWSRKA